MASFAILIAVQVGLGIASSFLQPKPKQQPIDRGKQDDLRFTIVEEGAFIPRVYGDWVRLGGNLFWGTPTQEHRSTTPGSSGGKKGRGAEPPTTTFFYDKSWAAYCCEGPIRSFRKIKEGDTVIFNQATEVSSYYEAERPANTLAGGATIVVDPTLLSGKKVRLPAGASVTFNGVRAIIAGAFDLGIYYQSDVVTPITVRVNGTTDFVPPSLPDNNNALAVADVPIVLAVGNNTIKITNNHGSQSLDIDRIFVFAQLDGDVTGIVDDGNPYPTDLNDPSGFYNRPIRVNHQGTMTGTVAAAGQANIEFYLGTEDQPQSPTIVTAEGSANVSGHRGLAGIVAKDYQIQNGQLQNLTFEIEPLLSDLADICIAEYKLRGATDAQLDFEALRGTIVEGLYIDRLAPLTETMEALRFFYNFDIVPADGKIKAVLRGGASVRTIPFHELLAHQEGEQRPNGIRIEHVEAADLPGGLYIAYVSPLESKEFHSGSQFIPLGSGPSLEAETINLPLVVTNPDEIIAAGKRHLFGLQLEKDLHSLSLSPKHRDLIPTDVVTLQLPQNTIDVRLTSIQAALPGLVKTKALPEKAGLYNQTGVGQIGTGTEILKTKFPANTLLYLADSPPARDSDDGLFNYAAVCPRGLGNWEGAYLYEETIEDSDEFHRLAAFSQAATLGVLVSALTAVSGDLDTLDTSNLIIIDLYFDDDLFESHPEADIRARDVNMLLVGSGPFAQILKFTTATYENSFSPFVRRVKLSGLLHGLRGTDDGAFHGASAGTTVALLTDAIRRIPEEFEKLGEERKFKGATVGQALVDAPETLFTSNGASKRPLRCSHALVEQDTSNDCVITFTGHPHPDEEPASFAVEVWTSEDRSNPTNRKRSLPVSQSPVTAALLTLLSSHSPGTTDPEVIQNNVWGHFTVADGGSGDASATIAKSKQILTVTGGFVEAEIRPGNIGATGFFGLFDSANSDLSDIADLDNMLFGWSVDTNSSPAHVRIYVDGSVALDITDTIPIYFGATNPRLSIRFSGTEIRFHLNHRFGQQPVFIAPGPPVFPLVVGVGGPYTGGVFGITLQAGLSTIYSESQQIADFSAAQTEFFLRIHQVSKYPQVGAGFPLDLVVPNRKLLLESNDKLLLESNDKFLLE